MQTKDKTILFLGDSITFGTGASCQEKRYADIVTVEGEFAQGENYGVGGTRIAKQIVEVEERYCETFEMRARRMQDNADVVVVFGGTNDYGHGDAPIGNFGDKTVDSFYGAMDSLLNFLINKYPLATIIWITPIHRRNENNLINSRGFRTGGRLCDYVKAEKEVCQQYGIPVLDLYSTSGICPDVPVNCELYTTDGLHPNDRGHRRIADRLLQFIKQRV